MATATMKTYETEWRNKFLTADCKTIHEMIAALEDAANTLKQMAADGVVLDEGGGTIDDYACLVLVTADKTLAKKYGMKARR